MTAPERRKRFDELREMLKEDLSEQDAQKGLTIIDLLEHVVECLELGIAR